MFSIILLQIGAIFLWSFVYNIVRISAGASEGKANAYSDTQEQQIIQETEKLVPQNCLDRTLPIEHTYLPGDECVLILSASEIPQNELKVIASFNTLCFDHHSMNVHVTNLAMNTTIPNYMFSVTEFFVDIR